MACDILVGQFSSSGHCFLPLSGIESEWTSNRSTDERIRACAAQEVEYRCSRGIALFRGAVETRPIESSRRVHSDVRHRRVEYRYRDV